MRQSLDLEWPFHDPFKNSKKLPDESHRFFCCVAIMYILNPNRHSHGNSLHQKRRHRLLRFSSLEQVKSSRYQVESGYDHGTKNSNASILTKVDVSFAIPKRIQDIDYRYRILALYFIEYISRYISYVYTNSMRIIIIQIACKRAVSNQLQKLVCQLEFGGTSKTNQVVVVVDPSFLLLEGRLLWSCSDSWLVDAVKLEVIFHKLEGFLDNLRQLIPGDWMPGDIGHGESREKKGTRNLRQRRWCSVSVCEVYFKATG